MSIKARDLIIKPCDISVIKDFIEKNHYSHSINGVKITQCFSVTVNDNWLIGGVLFGPLSTTAWKRFDKNENAVLELRRLVLSDFAGKNSESRVVGFCLRWIKKNLKHVSIIVSYADPTFGHSGTIYRASNFIHDGMTPADKGYKDLETGKIYHSRALRTKYKGDYKPFVKRLRQKLANGELETVVLTPKHRYIYKLKNT